MTRSSSLQVVPPSEGGSVGFSFSFYGTYPDSDMFCKKELAGRTMEFTFDVSQTPLIGRRILLKTEDNTTSAASSAQPTSVAANAPNPSNPNQMRSSVYNNGSHLHQQASSAHNSSNVGTPNSPRRSASLSPADTAPLSGWKRPWMCQSRVRECLVNLLTTCGQRVGLPKSPSVSSDLIWFGYTNVVERILHFVEFRFLHSILFSSSRQQLFILC